MQSDRKKTANLGSEIEGQPLHDARMERPQLSGPPGGAEQAQALSPTHTPAQTPQELLHTSFSFETPRATIQESNVRVSAERIRQLRSSISLRSRQVNSSRDRQPNENTTISVTHGETVLDRLMAWIALSLKSLEMRLFSRPQPLPRKNSAQQDQERERKEKEAKAREQLQKAMKIRRSRK